MASKWEAYMKTRLEEIKAMAASVKTYGDWFSLKEAIDDELDFIRPSIKTLHREKRNRMRRIEYAVRREAAYRKRSRRVLWDDPVNDLHHGPWLDRVMAQLEMETAFRDELVEGRREMKTQNRSERRAAERRTKILGRERAGRVERGEEVRCTETRS